MPFWTMRLPERRTRVLFLLFLFAAALYLSEPAVPHAPAGRGDPRVPPEFVPEKPVKKMPDRLGERIAYDVRMGRVNLGSAYYHFEKRTELDGRPVNVILFETRVPQFYDLETIYCDARTFLPVRVERRVSRLVKPEKITEEYDQKNFTLTITRRRWTTEKTVIKKDRPIHNAILLPHAARNEPELDTGWSFAANLPQRAYTIKLVSRETVQVPAGEFEAYYFESEPRQIKIWLSADERRIPLKMEGMGAFNYRLEMREYTPY